MRALNEPKPMDGDPQQPEAQAHAAAGHGQAGWIALARHGKSGLARSGSYDAKGWDEWWNTYDMTGLAEGEVPPQGLAAVADAAHCLLASPLPRARQTLERVANGRKMEIDPVFVEAPLPSMPIPFLRFSPDTWGVISRVGWWLGIAGAGESRREAEERAARAADMLIRRAADHGNVLLCAHGWFNRMTGRALRERGWRCIHDGGDRHWSWRTYVPPRHHL